VKDSQKIFLNDISELGDSRDKQPSESHHLRYDCPYCLSVRGKVDTDGKLYVNVRKKIGFCFKCNTTVIIDHTAFPVSEVYEFEEFLKKYFYPPKKEIKEQQQAFDLSWTVPANESINVSNYLKFSRKRPVSVKTIREYNLRAASLEGNDVLVIPNKFKDGVTDFYQYRFISGGSKSKRYHSVTDAIRPLFNVERALKYKELIFTEGVFSAIAAGYNALALYGVYLTVYQLEELRTYDLSHIEKVYLALDGGVENRLFFRLYKRLRRILEVPFFKVDLPFGTDPDDVDFQYYFKLAQPYDAIRAVDF
jgi:hypothetical protein